MIAGNYFGSGSRVAGDIVLAETYLISGGIVTINAIDPTAIDIVTTTWKRSGIDYSMPATQGIGFPTVEVGDDLVYLTDQLKADTSPPAPENNSIGLAELTWSGGIITEVKLLTAVAALAELQKHETDQRGKGHIQVRRDCIIGEALPEFTVVYPSTDGKWYKVTDNQQIGRAMVPAGGVLLDGTVDLIEKGYVFKTGGWGFTKNINLFINNVGIITDSAPAAPPNKIWQEYGFQTEDTNYIWFEPGENINIS